MPVRVCTCVCACVCVCVRVCACVCVCLYVCVRCVWERPVRTSHKTSILWVGLFFWEKMSKGTWIENTFEDYLCQELDKRSFFLLKTMECSSIARCPWFRNVSLLNRDHRVVIKCLNVKTSRDLHRTYFLMFVTMQHLSLFEEILIDHPLVTQKNTCHVRLVA